MELEALEALAENDGKSIADILAAKEKGALANASMRDFITLEMNENPGRSKRLDELWMSIFDVVADTLEIPEELRVKKPQPAGQSPAGST